MKTKIEELAEKNNIPIDIAEKSILRHHELTNLQTDKDTEVISVELTEQIVIDFLDKITKTFNVSSEAVLYASLINRMKEDKNIGENNG